MSSKNIKVFAVADVFSANEVYNLEMSQFAGKIGAVRVEIATQNRENARLRTLQAVYSEFCRILPDGELWWLAADAFGRPDNRIIRYKNFKTREELEIVEAREQIRKEHNCKEGVRLLLAQRVTTVSLEEIAINSEPLRCSYLIYVPQNFDVGQLLENIWGNTFPESTSLLSKVCIEGFLCKAYGSFDDLETGWLILAKPTFAMQVDLEDAEETLDHSEKARPTQL